MLKVTLKVLSIWTGDIGEVIKHDSDIVADPVVPPAVKTDKNAKSEQCFRMRTIHTLISLVAQDQ